jgi:3,4-dihydroxy 2-butanone 4-phosphate synthase/GTP cyclohydrolase II
MRDVFAAVELALEELRNGRMIILADDENRENEGDLVIAADFVTAEDITFMSRQGCGLICLPMANALVDKLGLSMMSQDNRSRFGTAFTVSIEAADGIATGISSKDRAHTIHVAISPESGLKDVISPGHVFPLRANEKGVLVRRGQTEGSVDLMKIAGLTPAAVICEIMNEDGTMSRRDELVKYAKKHSLVMITINDIINYRLAHETLIDEVTKIDLPLERYGEFSMTLFKNQFDNEEHFALFKKPVDEKIPPLVRIHSECITGDVFGSCKCDCGAQLHESLARISNEGGLLIYLRQEGRGVGLTNKIKAYALQAQGYDTVEANLKLGLPVDSREYGVAYQMLKFFRMNHIRLLTNNPKKVEALTQFGIDVVERVELILSTETNKGYLKTKQDKLGHLLGIKSS